MSTGDSFDDGLSTDSLDFSTSFDSDFSEESTEVIKPFSPGSFFAGRFQIMREVARGGMGAVYAARDLKTDATVALKIASGIKSKERAARFKREAEILMRLRHPGIVKIYDFGESEDSLWLSMEFLHGETLRQRIESRGKMDAGEFAVLLQAAALALSTAHAAGVVHRDLKPDNIFIVGVGVSPIKILDFGLSTIKGGERLTAKDSVIGTPRFMAPEQITSVAAASVQSDVYSLGIITYEALTGKSPFVASDYGQLLGAVMQGRRTPLHVARPDLSEELCACVERAIAKEPHNRFPTARVFAEAFSRSLGVDPRGSVLPSLASPATRRVGLFLGGVVLVVGTAILTYLLLRGLPNWF